MHTWSITNHQGLQISRDELGLHVTDSHGRKFSPGLLHAVNFRVQGTPNPSDATFFEQRNVVVLAPYGLLGGGKKDQTNKREVESEVTTKPSLFGWIFGERDTKKETVYDDGSKTVTVEGPGGYRSTKEYDPDGNLASQSDRLKYHCSKTPLERETVYVDGRPYTLERINGRVISASIPGSGELRPERGSKEEGSTLCAAEATSSAGLEATAVSSPVPESATYPKKEESERKLVSRTAIPPEGNLEGYIVGAVAAAAAVEATAPLSPGLSTFVGTLVQRAVESFHQKLQSGERRDYSDGSSTEEAPSSMLFGPNRKVTERDKDGNREKTDYEFKDGAVAQVDAQERVTYVSDGVCMIPEVEKPTEKPKEALIEEKTAVLPSGEVIVTTKQDGKVTSVVLYGEGTPVPLCIPGQSDSADSSDPSSRDFDRTSSSDQRTGSESRESSSTHNTPEPERRIPQEYESITDMINGERGTLWRDHAEDWARDGRRDV